MPALHQIANECVSCVAGYAYSAGSCVATHLELAEVTVPCEDNPSGAEYQAIDYTADEEPPYSYYLREYETTGGIQTYGPVIVDVAVKTDDDGVTESEEGLGMDSEEAAGCAVSPGLGGSAAMLLLLGALIVRRRRRSRRQTS